MRSAAVAAAAASTSVGSALTLGLLVGSEAGLPIPVPSDLLMFGVGERVAAGALPLWVAVVGLEVVAVVGTAIALIVCRGPGQRLVARIGPHLGLTRRRVARTAALLERRGLPALAIGRGTPGLRTITVVAAGASGLTTRRALPALVVGSSVFLQLHLALGLVLGPLARDAFDRAKGPTVLAALVLLAAAAAFWFVRRGRKTGAQAWSEAACPLCLGLALLAEHADRASYDAADGRPIVTAG